MKNLVPFSNHLLLEMEEIERKPFEEQAVGTVFSHWGHYIKMYQQHCTNLSTIDHLLVELLEKEKDFKIYHETTRKNKECRNLDFSSYVIKPFQRVCKYPLFLRELYRNCPPQHIDYSELKKAYSFINAIVQQINENKRLYDNNTRIIVLQKKLDWGEIGKIKFFLTFFFFIFFYFTFFF